MRAGTVTSRSASKAMMLVLLLLALFARGLVPAGYMIAPTENGWPTLTLCSGSGPLAVSGVEKHHGHGSKHDGHKEDGSASGSCAFATLLAPVLPPPPFHFAAAVLPPEEALTGFALRTIAVRNAAAAPPPSTGPPLLA